MLLSILVFIITLVILVLIHELGHFWAAKKAGIRVLEFGIGIPPKAWGKKIGQTLVSLNWLPFGGFVRLLGEDEVDKEILQNKYSFAAKSVGKRIMVVVAGVTMNLLFAVLLFYLVLGFQNFKVQIPLPSLIDYKFVGVQQTTESMVLIQGVAENSPAVRAGLKPGDQILVVNTKPISSDQEFIEITRSLAGQEVRLTVRNVPTNEEERTVTLTPRKDPPPNEGAMGVMIASLRVATLEYQTPSQKLLAGPVHSWNLISYSGQIFGRLISQSLATKSVEPVSQSVSGPVGITSIAQDILTTSDEPLVPYLNFVAILSLNLALVNILPIPAMDGGRLVFLLIEWITGRRVKAEVERWVHTVGIALLISLTLAITFLDIRKIFS